MNQEQIIQVETKTLNDLFGEKNVRTAIKMASILHKYVDNGERFTGNIVFTVNCRMGGIGNVEAFVQKKVD